MIEMTWGQIRSPLFNQGFRKIVNQTFDVHMNRSVAKILRDIQKEQEDAEAGFKKLIDKHGETDAQKNWKIKPENTEAWEKEIKELTEVKFTMPWPKISASKLEKVELNPAEFLALEPVLHDLEIVEGAQDGKENLEKEAKTT